MPSSGKGVVASSKALQDVWGPTFKESGLESVSFKNLEEALSAGADCFLVDTREAGGLQTLKSLRNQKSELPVLSIVRSTANREDLNAIRYEGAFGVVSEDTPAIEIAVRIRAMLEEMASESRSAQDPKELRAAKRHWFQQEVEFKVFDRSYKAWSTTLSQTGIFLRTSLSFPLYSTIHLQFRFMGDPRPFECDGVIVRQETEGEIHGIGIMFQNLKGEAVLRLENFLDLYR